MPHTTMMPSHTSLPTAATASILISFMFHLNKKCTKDAWILSCTNTNTNKAFLFGWDSVFFFSLRPAIYQWPISHYALNRISLVTTLSDAPFTITTFTLSNKWSNHTNFITIFRNLVKSNDLKILIFIICLSN